MQGAWWTLLLVTACGNPGAPAMPADAARPDAAAPDAVPDVPPATRPSLQIAALGVQGFALQVGTTGVLTAPMFTRQSTFAVSIGLSLDPDLAAIQDGMSGVAVADLDVIVSGHAHYDHLMDVPPILGTAAGATLLTNRSGKHMLAAHAPDRPGCTNDQPTPVIARDRVIAMDEPTASHVDYTNCPQLAPPGAPMVGTPVTLAGGRIRVAAVCTTHPDQIGPIHFGEGSVDSDQCSVPRSANGWLEGMTISFVIDFLDDAGGVAYRVFYQDAPATSPVGEVPPALLAQAPVDVAILCVGSNDAVDDQPTDILANLSPRFVVSGHWEDFFQPRSSNPDPIPLLDVATYTSRAEAAVADPAPAPWTIDGRPSSSRHVLAREGMDLVVPARP